MLADVGGNHVLSISKCNLVQPFESSKDLMKLSIHKLYDPVNPTPGILFFMYTHG